MGFHGNMAGKLSIQVRSVGYKLACSEADRRGAVAQWESVRLRGLRTAGSKDAVILSLDIRFDQ